MYGEGVEDDETLPFLVADMATGITPYNFAFHGHGPFDVLAQIESIDFSEEVRERHGVLLWEKIAKDR